MPYFLTDDNVKINYETSGEGSTALVFIHGWSVNQKFFKNQISPLSEKYKVVTFDLRGQGNSEESKDGYTIARNAQDLKNLIDYLGLKKVVLLGWSMGSFVMFDYIRQFGCKDLYKIVIMDMTSKLLTDDDYKFGLFGHFTHVDNQEILHNMITDWNTFITPFASGFYAKSGCKIEGLVEWTLEQELKNSVNVMARMWIDMSYQDYRSLLPQITIPTLIAFGEESALYNPDNSEYLHSMINDSIVVGFPNCGHAIFLEDPDKFNQEIKKFVG